MLYTPKYDDIIRHSGNTRSFIRETISHVLTHIKDHLRKVRKRHGNTKSRHNITTILVNMYI